MTTKTEIKADDNSRSLKVTEIQKAVKQFSPVVGSLNIRTAEDLKEATEVEARLKASLKRIEDLRLFFVQDITRKVAEINTEFRNLKKPYQEMFDEVDNKVLEYRRKEREKQEAERLKAEAKERAKFEKQQAKERAKAEAEAEKRRKELEKEELSRKEKKAELDRIEAEKQARIQESEKQEFDFDDSDFNQNKTIHSDSGAVTFAKKMDFRIVNEDEIPREFLIVDEKKIRKAISEGVRSIKGVDIFETEKTNIKS